jgi:hypothetical protein
MRSRKLEAAELSVFVPLPIPPSHPPILLFLGIGTFSDEPENRLITDLVFFCFVCVFFYILFSFFLLPDPVLFASSCGGVRANPPSSTTAAIIRNKVMPDLRLTSVSAAVEFSKDNNLLGVFLDTYLLVCRLLTHRGIFILARCYVTLGQGAFARSRCT